MLWSEMSLCNSAHTVSKDHTVEDKDVIQNVKK